jgi:hypothetical protein
MIQAIIHHRHCRQEDCEAYSRVFVRSMLNHTDAPEHHDPHPDGSLPEGPCQVSLQATKEDEQCVWLLPMETLSPVDTADFCIMSIAAEDAYQMTWCSVQQLCIMRGEGQHHL